MNIKLKIIKIQIELLRSIMHLLLNYKEPTNKIVVFCSQQLDKVIVKHHKVKVDFTKATLTDNRAFNTNRVHLQKLAIHNIPASLIQMILLVTIGIYI